MATSFQAHVHQPFQAPYSSCTHALNVPGLNTDSWASNGYGRGPTSALSRFGSESTTTATLTDLVRALEPRNSNGMALSKLIGADHERLLEWIRSERMRKLPAEGSSYDKVLICARLFVERLHSFDGAIRHFAQESHMATQLAYIHCASLLGLGEENSDALLEVFSLFYRCSVALDNLLSRAELFAVSQSIKDQVILALADLVTLVVGVATHFYKSLGDLKSGSVAVDIHGTFGGAIGSFDFRCSLVAELMWKHQLEQEGVVEGRVTEIKLIRQWLAPEDPVLADITKSTAQFAQEREESTCLWVNPYLVRFLKGQQRTLAITGKPGSGKSILATVINDQLQHPIGGVSYAPLFVPINSRVPALTTPAAVAKSILSQLFASRIGNVNLYRTLSETYERCRKTVDEEQYVNLLWDAVTNALPASLTGAKQTVLIIDGVDEATCGQSALLQRLQTATAGVSPSSLKLVVLGSETQLCGLAEKPSVQITPGLVFDDVAAVVRRVLMNAPAFNQLAVDGREMLVNRIVKAADGSFLWAKLASKKVREESAPNGQALVKAVDEMLKAKYSISDLVSHKLRSPDLHQDGARIVGWLASAARPLAIAELCSLLCVQLEKGVITDTDKVEPLNLLKPLAALVFCQNNMVYLRHGRIRSAVTDAFARDKSKSAIKSPQIDLIRRMSLYIQKTVAGRDEPSLEPADSHLTSGLIERYPLLDFAVRYWMGNTKIAFGCNTDQEIATAKKELGGVFPTSVLVPLLAMTVWENKSTPALALLYRTQARLYEQILGSKHPASLQAVLCQALFYQTIEDVHPSQASLVFYNAATTCQHVLSTQHVITMQLTQHFLEYTASQVTTSKTEIMIKRVEMLRLLVECYKIHYGNTSEMVLSTLHQLSEHYTAIHETHQADELNAYIQTIIPGATEPQPSRRPSEQSLVVQLHGPKEVIGHGTALILDHVEEDETITASFNFDALFAKAEKYVRESNMFAAEQTYIDLWQLTSREYRLQQSIAWELRSLKVIRAYAQLLIDQSREFDTASILSSFWEEHEHTMSSHEEVVAQFVAVAELMKVVKLSSLSLEVLSQCAQSISQQSSLYKEIQGYHQSTLNEFMGSEEFYESTVTESMIVDMISSVSIDAAATVTATSSVVQNYLSQHRWKDATTVLKRTLRAVWPSFFAPSVNDVALPSKEVESCIKLAQRLRKCYRYRRRTLKEEDVCLRLYRAVQRGRPAGDNLLRSITQDLIRLYERTRQTDKLIALHQEILDDYTQHFGRDHPMVLQELWVLAGMTRPQAMSVDYYRRIFELLNKDSPVCAPAAFEPLVVVVTELINQGRYSEVLGPARILFNSLQNTQISIKLRDPDFVRSVYERYVFCLRKTQADYHVIHDVTVQYRKTCLAVFGATAAISIHATQTLAYIAQESKEYESEAVELLQSLLQIQSDEVHIDHADITAMLETISEAQSAVLVSTSVATLSQQEFHRIISRRTERWKTVREEYGYAHESSLSQMQELVSMYSQRKESYTAVSMLQETAVHIVSKERSSARLIAAAKSIAASYRAAGEVHRAKQFALEIYQQLVAKDSTNVSAVGFDLVATASQHQGLLFLAQLEYSLREREEFLLTLNEVYSSLMAESLYFEQLRRELRSKTSTLQSTLEVVCHLQGLLLARGHSGAVSRLVERLTDYFMEREGQKLSLKHSQASIFLSTIMGHFQSHASHNFLRSICLASYNRVSQLLASKDVHHRRSACDLAIAAFRYIEAHHGFPSPQIMKLVFKTGLALASSTVPQSSGTKEPPSPSSQSAEQQEGLQVSYTILNTLLTHCKTQSIDLTHLHPTDLNTLIKLLDTQKAYPDLAWLLTSLWDRRQKSPADTDTDLTYTIALGRRLVITRYLIGETTSSIRLAEDLVYNCARVQGPTHPSTLEMTILLSQLYTSVAQGYHSTPEHRDLASQYYRKAAGLHENALRGLIDPASASTTTATMFDSPPASPGATTSPGAGTRSPGAKNIEEEGKSVRRHLRLLKLAVERLGGWPKEYAEYEHLNEELFRVFPQELRGESGKGLDMHQWNSDLKRFGAGKAEASDDLISERSYPAMEGEVDLGRVAIAV
ncbi:hypothetical protein BJX61DRAFT_546814 [Aspergillus egyptiacus]|nr:hypothetical protein BJX61DRAFT_546814 [Aspergillus egyptiacus]